MGENAGILKLNAECRQCSRYIFILYYIILFYIILCYIILDILNHIILYYIFIHFIHNIRKCRNVSSNM